MGRIDNAGSIATKIVLPVPVLVSGTATIGGLVWSKDPEALRKINETRLAEIGVSKQGASRYLVNGNYTLTMQTRLIAALHEVKVKGCADYVDTAADADDEREALFFVESAEWLAGMHKTEPVSSTPDRFARHRRQDGDPCRRSPARGLGALEGRRAEGHGRLGRAGTGGSWRHRPGNADQRDGHRGREGGSPCRGLDGEGSRPYHLKVKTGTIWVPFGVLCVSMTLYRSGTFFQPS